VPTKRTVNSIIGFLICGWAAASTSLVFWNHKSRTEVPLWFVFVVAGVAICYGFGRAFLGTSFAAFIFFAFLIAPLEPLSYQVGRLNVIYLIAAGAAISYLLSASPRFGKQEEHHIRVVSRREKNPPAAHWTETADSTSRISEDKHEIESV